MSLNAEIAEPALGFLSALFVRLVRQDGLIEFNRFIAIVDVPVVQLRGPHASIERRRRVPLTTALKVRGRPTVLRRLPRLIHVGEMIGGIAAFIARWVLLQELLQ